jgi:hypothetical protein
MIVIARPAAVKGLGAVGFAEDEINKIEAANERTTVATLRPTRASDVDEDFDRSLVAFGADARLDIPRPASIFGGSCAASSYPACSVRSLNQPSLWCRLTAALFESPAPVCGGMALWSLALQANPPSMRGRQWMTRCMVLLHCCSGLSLSLQPSW